MQRIVYVGNRFVAERDAHVSIMDRGFLFGDGVYEVVAVLGGKLVDFDAHMARLRRSLAEIAIRTDLSDPDLKETIVELIGRNSLVEGVVYLQVTRGTAERDFICSKEIASNLVMFTQVKALREISGAKLGIAVKSLPDLRWARRDIKSTSLLAQVLAKQSAADAGCQEAWMVDESGLVTEGASSSAFIVDRSGAIRTRKNSNAILAGCTRRALMALSEESGVTIVERAFSLAEAIEAREAFLTSASTFLLPVVSIDGKPVGDGRPGPTARRLRELYVKFAESSGD
jgi:D-alanine transaminase